MKKKSDKLLVKRTSIDAIATLLEKAQNAAAIHPERTKRYVAMAWGLVKKYKISLTKEQKTKFCRKCLTFFILDKTAHAFFNSRTNSFYIQCKSCGFKRRL